VQAQEKIQFKRNKTKKKRDVSNDADVTTQTIQMHQPNYKIKLEGNLEDNDRTQLIESTKAKPKKQKNVQLIDAELYNQLGSQSFSKPKNSKKKAKV
jgi:hypothetical protein